MHKAQISLEEALKNKKTEQTAIRKRNHFKLHRSLLRFTFHGRTQNHFVVQSRSGAPFKVPDHLTVQGMDRTGDLTDSLM